MSETPMQDLIDLRSKANDMWTFKGRAELLRKIQGSIDFIRSHKTEQALERMLLKERTADYEVGLEIMNEKYKEQPGEATD